MSSRTLIGRINFNFKMTFFIQLTDQLQNFIPIEIIEEILKYISIENLFRLGIDEEKLNYFAKYIPFENITEHPEVYIDYEYDKRCKESLSGNKKWKNWSKSKNLKFNMMNIPRVWYPEYKCYKIQTFNHLNWFLCDPILFKCYLENFTPEMEETIIKYDDYDDFRNGELLFIRGRLDLLHLISRELAYKFKLTDNEIFYRRAVKNPKCCLALLEYLLELNGHDAEINKRAMLYAVCGGRIEIVKWLIDKGQKWDSDTIDCIVRQGKIELLILLNENKFDGCGECTTDAMDDAALKGHIEIIKYLTENGIGSCTTNAMDRAAEYGKLEMVKYLSENRTEGCTTNAMHDAAINGYLEIVMYLSENRSEGCTINAIDIAAQRGHFEIVKYLSENRSEGCSSYALNWASANGYIEIVKHLSEYRTEGCTTDALDWAAENSHFEIVKYLSENRSEGCTTNAIDWAADNGHLEMVKYLSENRSEGFTTEAIHRASGNGHFEVVKYLYENKHENFNNPSMKKAMQSSLKMSIEFNNLDFIKWMHQQNVNGLITSDWQNEARILAAPGKDSNVAEIHKRLLVIEWFKETFPEYTPLNGYHYKEAVAELTSRNTSEEDDDKGRCKTLEV